jgi:capsular exopolysaccharide synthesis family protein
LVVGGGASSASIEQYRRFAASMLHLQAAHGLQRLMVTSSVPREGKTLTVANLALSLSESYQRRVLLIDADLRRPSVHEVFGTSNSYGLCEVLRSASRPPQFLRVSPTLSVLPAGSPGPSPMADLASERMERLLDEVTASFDWVLLDAPPIALMADAGLLARLTRAVILVVAANSTPYSLVEKMVAELGREHIVGTVLNRSEEEPAQWSAYYSSSHGGAELSAP